MNTTTAILGAIGLFIQGITLFISLLNRKMESHILADPAHSVVIRS
jgi:hypothetical protein